MRLLYPLFAALSVLVVFLVMNQWSKPADFHITSAGLQVDTIPYIEWHHEQRYQNEDRSTIVAYEYDSTRVITITDSLDNVVATWRNGKWSIQDCEKAIETALRCLRVQSDLLNNRRVEEINNNPVKPVTSAMPLSFPAGSVTLGGPLTFDTTIPK